MTTPHHDCDCDHSHPQSKYEQALSHYDLHLHDEQVAEAVRRLLDEHKAEYDTDEVKRQLIGTLELTSLKVTDSAESILALTERVNDFADAHPDLPHLATICVYPNFAQIVSQSLQADGVEVACVAGGFPSSQTFAEIKTAETALAVHDGATEIDCVMSVGAYLSGDYETLCDEIAEIKAACADRPLKVILETGALPSAMDIKRASLLAIYAGADFIKTSTGKIEPAATPEAAYVRRQHRGRRPHLLHHRARSARRKLDQRRSLPHRHEPLGQPAGQRRARRAGEAILSPQPKRSAHPSCARYAPDTLSAEKDVRGDSCHVPQC